MQAFVNSRLGLQQPAATAPRQRSTPAALHKREGALWASVTILAEHATSPSLQCNNCGKKFCGGATHIRDHICERCTCDTPAFMELKQRCIEKKEETASNKKQKTAEKEVEEASEEKVAVKSETKVFAQQGLAASLKAAKAEEVDEALAELFFGDAVLLSEGGDVGERMRERVGRACSTCVGRVSACVL